MATFLKEMENIIKENEKLKEENHIILNKYDILLKENMSLKTKSNEISLQNSNYDNLLLQNSKYDNLLLQNTELINANIEIRVKLNEKNRELNEKLLKLKELKKYKISRGKKIGLLIKRMNELSKNLSQIIIEKDKIKIEKEKLEIDNNHWKSAQVRDSKLNNEKIKKLQTELSQYINQENQIKKWFDDNSNNINFKVGKELYDIIKD